MQVTYYAHAELKEDVSKWNTSAYGYRQSMDIDPMGDAYLHLTDSQCANIDSSNNFNIPAFNWMGSENDVIMLCFDFLFNFPFDKTSKYGCSNITKFSTQKINSARKCIQ